MLIGVSVATWHRNESILSAELIDSFVRSIEKQAEESALRYETDKETHVMEDTAAPGEEGYARVVDVHAGLDSESWDLEKIFKEYFPNLQRRSAFLTVWGYFEHELDKLCALYKSEKGLRLDLADLSGQGVDRSTSYLDKVAGLNVHKTSQEWNQIRNIQKVRNIVAHRDGRLADRSGATDQSVLTYIRNTQTLGHDGEILIKEGFLGSVLDCFKAYFKLLGESIAVNEATRTGAP